MRDKDPIKPDDFLGKVVLTTSQFFPDGFEAEVPLVEAGDGIEAFMKLSVVVVHPKVRVNVVSAKGLRNADWVGKSDPYCTIGILGKPDVKFDTVSVDDNLNPQWNHEAEVVGYQVEDSLTFTIKDKDPLKPDDILGSVSLPYESFKDAGFEGELQLAGTGEGIASFVQVKVELGEKVEQVVESVATPIDRAEKEGVVEEAASPIVSAVEITAATQSPQAKSCWC